MVSVLSLQPQLHLPLKSVALCLDCERCFELGSPVCPACGSETWTALARFLEAGMALLGKGLSRLVDADGVPAGSQVGHTGR